MTRITLDGFELFKAIGTHRDVFASAEGKVDKAAELIVLGHFKAASVSVASLAALLTAIGDRDFSIALDHFGTADLKKVLKKIDPHFPQAKNATDVLFRMRIQDLASHRVMPAEKPADAAKASRKTGKEVAIKRTDEWPSAMSPPVRKAG